MKRRDFPLKKMNVAYRHVDRISAKSNRSLGFIKRNLNRCTEDIQSLAYCSLVRPSLEYCAAVWDPYTNDLIYKLEAVQRRAASFVKNNYDRQSSVTTMLKDLEWSTVADRRKITSLRDCQFFTKHMKDTSPYQSETCCTRSPVPLGEPITNLRTKHQ